MHGSQRHMPILAVSSVLAVSLLAAPIASADPTSNDLEVRILTIGDFNSALQPPEGDQGTVTQSDGTRIEAGGAAYVGTLLDQLRRQANKSMLLSAGNNIQPNSGDETSTLLHHEPTIDLLNKWNVDASAVGGHELADGLPELLRKSNGGCHADRPCDDPPFEGAQYPHLGANIDGPEGDAVASPFVIRHFDGIPVGVIGVTSRSTDNGAAFHLADELESITRSAEALEFFGVKAMVLLLHDPDSPESPRGPNDCGAENTRAYAIASQATTQVDAIITSGGDTPYYCTVADPEGSDRVLIHPAGFGKSIAVTDLNIDRTTGEVRRDRVSAFNQIVTRNVEPDPTVEEFIRDAENKASALSERRVGELADIATRDSAETGESGLGKLLADAAAHAHPEADAVLLHPGLIRADLRRVVTYGDIHAAIATAPLAVTELTGAQLRDLLEQQFRDDSDVILQPSAALSYTVDNDAELGHKVSDPRIGDEPISPTDTYRIVVDSHILDPASGFTAQHETTPTTSDKNNTDALRNYIESNTPVAVGADERISRTSE
ncbi:bifunctional metallophosphatase/5'-nucleotidase [Hoyosella rhizosphaerae]|uniref:Bifunctional metallophosphatase/5'-nucleotidase n=1 Tax=Hoyosella rhizosphaerae TaxID=1755582 RepID=A0A916XI45_9ACTN|nr:bifunctional metallophosphatase/5'-nucleotidase [Hoyosella rhizosphaerae]MBN4925445.1 bifunctional metallophosphatase/5'-nucleotidase [Hoyosella rhizosphaerae]GGC75126.1 bifunctional metallophosphatase/5'-nucleotidase [Hoyosella rhizosphaerae]